MPRQALARGVVLLRWTIGALALGIAVVYVSRTIDTAVLWRVAGDVLGSPAPLAAALTAYAAAFGLRAWAWTHVLPTLSPAMSWAALHVSTLGNHVLPLRLGEVLRVTSVLRRTPLPAAPVIASTVVLRTGDLLALLALAALTGLTAPFPVLPEGAWQLLAAVGLLGVGAAGWGWLHRLRGRADVGTLVRLPGVGVAAATIAAWLLEAGIVWQVAHAAGLPLSWGAAVAVTAATIVAQAVAITPGGFGTYEAMATAALVATGADPATAVAVAVSTHALKTLYSLVVGAVALLLPAPSYWGRLRLPRTSPQRPDPWPVDNAAPVVAMLPAHNEAATLGAVLRRLPAEVSGRALRVVVVDDGSTDASARIAAQAGAEVVAHACNLGLGAAVRTGLAVAVGHRPAAVVYLDADGEYAPEEIERLAGPILTGEADYVVGSRFAGHIGHMLPQRRLGNVVLTHLLRLISRRADLTDGQSGYRAFSPAAAAHAEVVHDYNYAQVLTLDLLAKGYRYAEVPISYSFRESGTSFVRLGHYLRRVLPAVRRELNAPSTPQPAPPARVAL